MNIENYKDVISACRFCFMCRHLATIGNVSFKESDTPRGRALIADKVLKDKQHLKNQDYIDCFYRAELSAASRKHCVSSYDEASLVRAMREDIVDAGLEPEKVKKIAEALRQSGNPFGATEAGIKEKGTKGKPALLYYIDAYTLYKEPKIAESFMAILEKAGLEFSVLKEIESSGKAFSCMGYRKEAAAAAAKTLSAIRKTGCTTLVTSCPASFDAFKNDYQKQGAALDGIEILHSSQFIAELFKNKKLKAAGKTVKISYIDSDYLKNYNSITEAPRKALEAAGFELVEFGSNTEESYAMGEGSVVYDQVNPELLPKLKGRLLEKSNPGQEIVSASPYTKYAFNSTPGSTLKMRSLEEAIAGRIS